MRKADFVRNQLEKIPEADWTKEGSVKIKCPFHDDTNPSLDVSLITIPKKVSVGGFNCWSCRTHGPWNDLAKKLGLLEWNPKDHEGTPDNEFLNIASDIVQMEKRQQSLIYRKPYTEGAWEGPWRGLPGSFLRAHGAETYYDREDEEYRLYFPFQDLQGNLIGHILARPDNSDIPDARKYLNSWGMPANKHWYCLNFEKRPKTLVIVEGPYDTLRMRHLGIPAIGALGLTHIKEGKEGKPDSGVEKIMQIIAKGCKAVVLALDADEEGNEAGQKATPEYARLFMKWGIDVTDLNLSRYKTGPKDKIDPGNAPEKAPQAITDLKNFLKIP
jgi:hypothetical protein